MRLMLPKCPHCGKQVNWFRAWALKTQGEYRCGKCGECSNVSLDKALYPLAAVAAIAGAVFFVLFVTLVQEFSFTSLVLIAVPFCRLRDRCTIRSAWTFRAGASGRARRPAGRPGAHPAAGNPGAVRIRGRPGGYRRLLNIAEGFLKQAGNVPEKAAACRIWAAKGPGKPGPAAAAGRKGPAAFMCVIGGIM